MMRLWKKPKNAFQIQTNVVHFNYQLIRRWKKLFQIHLNPLLTKHPIQISFHLIHLLNIIGFGFWLELFVGGMPFLRLREGGSFCHSRIFWTRRNFNFLTLVIINVSWSTCSKLIRKSYREFHFWSVLTLEYDHGSNHRNIHVGIPTFEYELPERIRTIVSFWRCVIPAGRAFRGDSLHPTRAVPRFLPPFD